MPLTDKAVQNAKPGITPKGKVTDKPYKMGDGGGLYLEITPSSGKLWRLKYRFGGKEKRLAFGSYPAVTLKSARKQRTAAKEQLAQGIDPATARRASKIANIIANETTFEAIAREWFSTMRPGWVASHADKIIRRLERDVFPWLGKRPLTEISAPEILRVLRRIESRGVIETAHRAKAEISQVYKFAIATGRAEKNPAPDLALALKPMPKDVNFAAPVEPAQVGDLLRALNGFKGSLVVSIALRLAPLLFVRPGELRRMRWSELDFDRAEWVYNVTKTDTAHLVPLAAQAVTLLREIEPLTGASEWVFPGRDPKRPMSDAALSAALKRMGIDTRRELTTHGWRATARTMLHERLGFAPEVIEHQLAHAVPDALGTSYNRTKFIAERKRMMTAWANYLDSLRAGGNVIPLRAGQA